MAIHAGPYFVVTNKKQKSPPPKYIPPNLENLVARLDLSCATTFHGVGVHTGPKRVSINLTPVLPSTVIYREAEHGDVALFCDVQAALQVRNLRLALGRVKCADDTTAVRAFCSSDFAKAAKP